MKIPLDKTVYERELNKVEEFLSTALPFVDYYTPTKINDGGCGVFAGILSDNLTKLGIKHTIQAIYVSAPNLFEKYLKNFVTTGDNSFLRAAGEDHVQIEIDGVFFDSEGISMREPYLARDMVELTREQLRLLVDNAKWNQIFDRDVVPELTRRVDSVFEKFDNWSEDDFLFLDGRKGIDLTAKTLDKIKERHLMQLGVVPVNSSYLTAEDLVELRREGFVA